jgi:two-component system NtrC family sensor kinase
MEHQSQDDRGSTASASASPPKSGETALLEAQRRLEAEMAERTEQLVDARILLEADIARRKNIERELLRRNQELSELNLALSRAKDELAQHEKLAALGQLAAGVAHEINTPIAYVQSNLNALEHYLGDLFSLLDLYQQAVGPMRQISPRRTQGQVNLFTALERMREKVDLEFLRSDIPHLLNESKQGIGNVNRVVQGLKDFSYGEISEGWQQSDVNQALDASLKVAYHEIKYRAKVTRHYGELPLVECMPLHLTQVFMNLLSNAMQAIPAHRDGQIEIATGQEGDSIWIEVGDDGVGIAPHHLRRIFEPFFTTKSVGKGAGSGAGLGLSLSYGIIQKHHGEISVHSEIGKGTRFRLLIPVRQTAPLGQAGVALLQASR